MNLSKISLAPNNVGVENMPILRLWKFWVRWMPWAIGEPSLPMESLNRSTSSKRAMRIGRMARPEGALAPTMAMKPPAKSFSRVVFDFLRLLLASSSLP